MLDVNTVFPGDYFHAASTEFGILNHRDAAAKVGRQRGARVLRAPECAGLGLAHDLSDVLANRPGIAAFFDDDVHLTVAHDYRGVAESPALKNSNGLSGVIGTSPYW